MVTVVYIIYNKFQDRGVVKWDYNEDTVDLPVC